MNQVLIKNHGSNNQKLKRINGGVIETLIFISYFDGSFIQAVGIGIVDQVKFELLIPLIFNLKGVVIWRPQIL